MYGVELYAAVRLAVVDEGLSYHEAGWRFGIDRRTVKKMLSYPAPPGYRRKKPVRRPKLDGFTGIIDAILEADADPNVPRKQPHTAQRIFERLRDEHGFAGGYTIQTVRKLEAMAEDVGSGHAVRGDPTYSGRLASVALWNGHQAPVDRSTTLESGQTPVSRLRGSDQGWNTHHRDRATDVVGQRRDAELAAHVLQALGQKGTLAHPLLD